MTARTRRALFVPVLATVSALALAACSNSADIEEQSRSESGGSGGGSAIAINTSPDQDRIHTTVSDEAVALLPDGAFPDGVLRVSITQGAVPLGFFADDNQTVIGSETDIATLVADALDLELELVVNDWSNWPLATQSGEVDATISNVTVTEERKELFDFSTYRVDQLSWLVPADSDVDAIDEAADIAGLTVGVGSGTNQEQILLAWDEENQAAGLDPVSIDYYESWSDVTLALQSGRLDTYFGPNPTAAYAAATAPEDFAVVGTVNGGWPDTADIAVATARGNGLAEAFTAAINHAIDDGTYAEVLERWGLEAEAIDRAETNPPGLGA
ncbi:ABC transporter substrate-binding protein [Trujillonella endophytica]|uniref:Amino acid ABC transporter substrate-binding protein, PAAT family (TC 3.A.1.3.-) n=1 Tax=Trujillonella endophytica TaxID=673521 RepID=A0A1H8RWV8_9ACTN|nr:ABC transporter substrate-binding protein [Trujillella endophytica]SEO70413.1 amino acid ABC transporter substrate-binding protein, PAAT family (TC 3.A.1.3.-) [Trujillella endophytica]